MMHDIGKVATRLSMTTPQPLLLCTTELKMYNFKINKKKNYARSLGNTPYCLKLYFLRHIAALTKV